MRVLPPRGQNLMLSGMLLMVVLTVLFMARTSSMVGDDALDAHLANLTNVELRSRL